VCDIVTHARVVPLARWCAFASAKVRAAHFKQTSGVQILGFKLGLERM